MTFAIKRAFRFIGYWFCYWGTGGLWEGTLHFECDQCGEPFRTSLDMLAAMRMPQKQLRREEVAAILASKVTR